MESMLIDILAQTDAAFQPIRRWVDYRQPIASLEARRDFHSIGVRVPKTGGTGVDRAHWNQTLDRLEELGDVKFHRANGIRSFWKLTDVADWNLRGRCTGWRFSDSMVAMLVLRELTAAGIVNGHHVPDWILAGASNKNADRIFDLEAIFAPALCRAWVTSWSDSRGKVGYRLTDAGEQFIDGDTVPPGEGEFDLALGEKYLAAMRAASKNLSAQKPRHESAVSIPLSCGDWPAVGRKNIPSIFDRTGKVRTPSGMVRAILKSMDVKK